MPEELALSVNTVVSTNVKTVILRLEAGARGESTGSARGKGKQVRGTGTRVREKSKQARGAKVGARAGARAIEQQYGETSSNSKGSHQTLSERLRDHCRIAEGLVNRADLTSIPRQGPAVSEAINVLV